jgi:hypothetical protein
MEKIIISKIKKRIILLGEKKIILSIVETDPRLG